MTYSEAQKKPLLNGDPLQEQAFQDLKSSLEKPPALGLPDITQKFNLFIYKKTSDSTRSSASAHWTLGETHHLLV